MTITPGDFASLMRKLAEQRPETRHEQMVKLLCRTLESLGYADGVDVFRESERRPVPISIAAAGEPITYVHGRGEYLE